MAKTLNTRIVLRNDSIEQWQNSTLSLLQGEIALGRREDGSYDLRVGSGNKTWNELSSSFAISSDQVIGLNSALDGKFETKLDKIEFQSLSNAIGLSAATEANPVVTKDDIAGLARAMHFLGAVTPAEGQSDIDAITAKFQDPKAGDVVIITKNSKEYVYSETEGNWIELGAEEIYATKDQLAAETTQRTEADDYLSGKIDNKIHIGSYGADLTSSDLSIIKIDSQDYYTLVASGQENPNAVYIVSSDYVNGYDERIINVGAPISATDAVNLSSMNVAIDTAIDNIVCISCGNATL